MTIKNTKNLIKTPLIYNNQKML